VSEAEKQVATLRVDIEKFIEAQRSQRGTEPSPVPAQGSHVTGGKTATLAPDFVPSGGEK
jgi:hypothetical protein